MISKIEKSNGLTKTIYSFTAYYSWWIYIKKLPDFFPAAYSIAVLTIIISIPDSRYLKKTSYVAEAGNKLLSNAYPTPVVPLYNGKE